MKKPVVLVIDGQGGRIGKLIIEQLAARAAQRGGAVVRARVRRGRGRGGSGKEDRRGGEEEISGLCHAAPFLVVLPEGQRR